MSFLLPEACLQRHDRSSLTAVNVAMFGMNDPAQTLLQLERYIEDGRMEMSEVMATQFTEMFLSQKKRTADSQIMLVKGLRILCDVFLARGKLQWLFFSKLPCVCVICFCYLFYYKYYVPK